MQYYNLKYITRASKSSLICNFYIHKNRPLIVDMGARAREPQAPLQRPCRAFALLKYGYSSFTLEILEYCEISVLIEREQYYIDTLKPEYNILKVAGSLFGYKHTIESLQKMSEIASNRSEETIAKLREAALGKTYKHTEETKKKNKREYVRL
jgi:group I intron endonuclease